MKAGERRTTDRQVFARYLRDQHRPVAMLALLLLASAGLAVISPLFLRRFIDQRWTRRQSPCSSRRRRFSSCSRSWPRRWR